jgi:DNA-directed RNA polymerase I subunit RPA1
MPRVQVNAYICKLRLLQYGLIDALDDLDAMGEPKSVGKSQKVGDGSASEEEDLEDLMDRRTAYVRRCIRKAQLQGITWGFMSGGKDSVAIQRRRALVKEFLKDINWVKKCANCSG